MTKPGALSAALNWYRGLSPADIHRSLRHVEVPTLYVWADGDFVVGEKAARGCGRYVKAEFRFEALHGSHFLLDEQPDLVADLLLQWFAAHPV